MLPAVMRVNPALFLPLMAEYAAPTWAILISGFFMLLSVSLSMYLIFQHLSAYNNPEVCFGTPPCYQYSVRFVMSANNIHFVFVFFQEQKFVLGVILMVPCYAVESVISPKQLLFFFVGLGLFRYFSCVFDDLCFSSATVCFIGKS